LWQEATTSLSGGLNLDLNIQWPHHEAPMWYITMVKFRRSPTKADAAATNQRLKDWASKGIKIHEAFYTLGRYDQVWIGEAPDEKTLTQFALSTPADLAVTETMIAVSRDEATNWLK
jgi:uncharacterized protein with GYD domain